MYKYLQTILQTILQNTLLYIYSPVRLSYNFGEKLQDLSRRLKELVYSLQLVSSSQSHSRFYFNNPVSRHFDFSSFRNSIPSSQIKSVAIAYIVLRLYMKTIEDITKPITINTCLIPTD